MVRVSQSSAASNMALTDIRDQWQRRYLNQVTIFIVVKYRKENIVLIFCFFIIYYGLAYAVILGLVALRHITLLLEWKKWQAPATKFQFVYIHTYI